MISLLKDIEKLLPLWLVDKSGWNSVYVDYHKPYVARLWKQYGEYRFYLHKIFPCLKEESLFHPHPWSSAIKIVKGGYEMGVGYSESLSIAPDITTTFALSDNCYYEMLSDKEWHYVRPVNEPSYSIMVTGKPFVENQKPSNPELRKLNDQEIEDLLSMFKGFYS
ncbi:MAG: hypothetical protein J0G32_02705 [Alphaproteobacteria bacterium]|nr:hypothetical protein [Alphaproteobacteria bacterium]OJV13913.1 MAG: hypothetical protein BGO27_08470 [Alphaproteobacteria bacterium 33-17]